MKTKPLPSLMPGKVRPIPSVDEAFCFFGSELQWMAERLSTSAAVDRSQVTGLSRPPYRHKPLVKVGVLAHASSLFRTGNSEHHCEKHRGRVCDDGHEKFIIVGSPLKRAR